MAELKPCPFCGSRTAPFVGNFFEINGLHDEDEDCNWGVCCGWNNGGCGASCGYHETGAEAIEAWNRRADNGKL